MKKKGFTLIEVLSVIVVLSIIFSISVPKILDIVEKSRRKVFFTSATSIVNTVKTEYSQNLYNKNFEYKAYEFDKKYPSGYKQNSETLKLKGDLPSIGTVKLKDNGKIALAVVSHDERYCAKKDYSDAEVKVEDYVFGKCNLEVDGAIIGEEFQINITASPLEWSRSKEVTITHNADDRAKLQYQLGTTTGEWIDYQDTFVLEENTTIYARLYTSTNSIESSLTVTTIDREGPEIISSTNNITTKSAKVYYNITDSKSGVDNSSITCKYGDNYSENGTVVISSGNSVTCTMSGLKNNTEYKYKISAKDKLGNESIKESSITTGDFSTIAITEKSTGNIYEKWSTSKQITITSSLPTGTKLQYQLGTTTGSWTNYSSPFELTSNTTIYARITDDSNVSKAASLTVTTIDRIGPNTPTISLGYGSSGVYMGGYTNGTWTKYDVLTTANSSDSGSGIAYYQYSHDATTWSADISTLGWSYAYANGKNILAYWITWSGSWNFYIRAVDNLGNVSAPSNVFTLRIDKEPPTTPTLTNSSGGNWTNQNVTITASSTDSQTEVAYYQYSYDQVNWNGLEKGNYDIWSAERAQPVYIRAVDKVGNVSGISQTGVYIDKTPPIMWPRIDNKCNANGSVTTTAWAQDGGSGVAYFRYFEWPVQTSYSNASAWKSDWSHGMELDDGWQKIWDTWTGSRNNWVYFSACDNVGNCTKSSDGDYSTTEKYPYYTTVKVPCTTSSSGGSGSKTCTWVEQTNKNVTNCTGANFRVCGGGGASCLPSSQNTPKCYKLICN